MAFWGIEVKPGTPYVHRSHEEGGRLHLSQATLGDGSSSKKSILQCKVGDKKHIYLCSLLQKRLETCQLNHEFDEDDEVTFSVVGTHSVHLSGFIYGDSDDQDYQGHDGGDDSCEEDVMVSDFEDEDDSEDEEEDDDYIDDGLEMYSPSPVHNRGVRIEEIVDDEKPNNKNDSSKRNKRKKTDDKSEEEDGFPIDPSKMKTDALKSQTKFGRTNGEKTQKKSDSVHVNKLKRKIPTVDEDGKPTREIGTQNSNVTEDYPAAKNGNDLPSSEKKTKKKNKNKPPESGATPSANVKSIDENELVQEKQERKEAKSLQVRTYRNGLVIEELVMGKPDGKRASRGKKVRVRYIGKLQKNGKVFDSNVGRAPFEFRLGIGKVIKGWEVGVQGMRVGDKRRVTIPPSMGYGAKGARGTIPRNAWLIFDVELVEVK